MKSSTKANVLMLTGSTLMLAGVFAKPLGITSDFESGPILMAVVLIYLGYRASKQAKAAGQIPPVSGMDRRKRFLLMVGSCALACIAMPFVLPATGVALPFSTLIMISVVSFLICTGAIWLGVRIKT
jgi:hypothetical protein